MDVGTYYYRRGLLLHEAVVATKNSKELCESLLYRNPKLINEKDEDGNTALHIAAKYGNIEVCKLLLDRGTYVNVTNKKYYTPLHIAAKYGNMGVCELLIKHQASVNVFGLDCQTPFNLAQQSGNTLLIELLRNCGGESFIESFFKPNMR